MTITVTKKNQWYSNRKANKIIAFKELTKGEASLSQRFAAELLCTPKSTLNDWQKTADLSDSQLDHFFSTPTGEQLLKKVVVAAHFVIQFRGKGCRSTGEFIKLAGLSPWVAHSHGAMHEFAKRFESGLVEIGSEQRAKLAQGMEERTVILCEDETFHQGKPCLVAIDALSNYIFLEEYSETRTSQDWDRAVSAALQGLHVNIVSATSDEGTAILAHVKKTLNVVHSPDLFHVQYEVSKATSAALNSQKSAFEKDCAKVKKQLGKVETKYGKDSPQAEQKRVELRVKEFGFTQREQRCKKVRDARLGIGTDYHPVNLENGAL